MVQIYQVKEQELGELRNLLSEKICQFIANKCTVVCAEGDISQSIKLVIAEMLGNLLIHGEYGEVVVLEGKDKLVVKTWNTIPSMEKWRPPEAKGRGFGIIKMICQETSCLKFKKVDNIMVNGKYFQYFTVDTIFCKEKKDGKII